MSSLSRGLSEFIQGGAAQQQPAGSPTRLFTAHVLEVVKDEQSPYYDATIGPACIGSIKVKIVETQYNNPEDQHFYRAFPLDRGDYTLPLPGEAVICTIAQGNHTGGAGGSYIDLLYYMAIVSIDQQLTINAAPFLSSDAYHIDSGALGSILKQLAIDSAVLAKRFDGRIDFESSTYKRNIGVTKSMITDTVLEGRFGGLIKLTSNSKDRWSTDQVSNINAGLPTDPFIVMKASRRYSTDVGPSFDVVEESSTNVIDDNPNNDDSSVYITTTQNIPAILSCSEKLSTWNYEQTLGTVKGDEDEASANLSTVFGGGFDQNAKIKLKLEGTIKFKKKGT